MASYYKYADRELKNEINWSEIGGKISQALDEKRDRILKTTQEVDSAYQEYNSNVNQYPVGENMAVNRFANDFSSDLQDASLMLHRKLQAGDITLRDYNYRINNLRSGTDAFFSLVKGLQAEQAEIGKRTQNGENAYAERWLAARRERLSNLAETGAYINPEDFSVGVAKLVKDPNTGAYKVSGDPSDIMGMNFMLGGLGQRVNSYDVNGEIQKVVGAFGKDIRVYMDNMGYATIEDVRNKTSDANAQSVVNAYDEAKKNAIDAMLADRQKAAYVLTNEISVASNGKAYDFTDDPAKLKGNPHLILMVPDPASPNSGVMMPELTEDQANAVTQKLSEDMDVMLDYKEDRYIQRPATPSRPPATPKPTQGEQQAAEALTNYEYLYSGTPEQIKTAETYFKGRNSNIRRISKSPTGVVIEYLDTTPSFEIDLVDNAGNPIPFADAVSRGSTLINNQQALSVLARNPLKPQYNPASYAGSATVQFVDPNMVDMTRVKEDGKEDKSIGIGVAQAAEKYLTSKQDEDLVEEAKEFTEKALLRSLNDNWEYSGFTITTHDHSELGGGAEDDYLEVYNPTLMTAPLRIPMTNTAKGNTGWKRNVGKIVDSLIRLIGQGRTDISPSELKQWFMPFENRGKDAFSTYNPVSGNAAAGKGLNATKRKQQ